MIYMDNAATTPLSPDVLDAMLPFLRENFGNPSTLYILGRKAHAAIERARESVASVINARPDEIYFTSSGSEADNWALFGAVSKAFEEYPSVSCADSSPIRGAKKEKRPAHIITSKIEHHAVLNACRALERRGAAVTYLDVDKYGFVNPDDVREAIRDDTVLISIMAANNEIGTIEPIEKIGATAHERGILFHTDAVQAFAKEPLDVNAMNIDYLSASAHKIFGPKGVGFLYMRRGKSLKPLIYGGAQERGRRAGTENVAGIAGFGAAAEIAVSRMQEWNEREKIIRDRIIKNLLKINGCVLNGHENIRLANNVNVCIDGVEGEGLVMMLNEKGVAAGTGSACASGASEPSHVLKAIGRSHAQAFSGLRLSINHEVTEREADYAVECVKNCVGILRRR